MKKQTRQLGMYLLAVALAFYLLPALMWDAGYRISLLYVIFPTICLLTGFFCALRCRFRWSFPVAAAALFLPAGLLYFSPPALVFALLFGAAALGGSLCGSAARYLVRVSVFL